MLNTVKNKKKKINGYKKEAASLIGRQLLHLNLEPYFTFHFMSCSTFVTGSVSYVRAARFVFLRFSGSFFTRTLIFFRLTASPMTEPQNKPQECLTTFPVIISFAFLLRLIIYFISVEVQPSAIPDSRLLRIQLPAALPVKRPGPALLLLRHRVRRRHPGLCQRHRRPQTNPLHP